MNTITCPFCGESDYDLPGLKIHLLGSCEEFDAITLKPTPLGLRPLAETIRQAQVEAGEDAVVASLKARGLLP